MKHYLYLPLDVEGVTIKADAFVDKQTEHYFTKYGPRGVQRELWTAEIQFLEGQIREILADGGTDDDIPKFMNDHIATAQRGLLAGSNNKYNEVNLKVIRRSNVVLDWQEDRNFHVGTFNPGDFQKKDPRRHTKPYKIGEKRGPLGIVAAVDRVMVNGHGGISGDFLGFHAHRADDDHLYVISPETLAQLFEADDLTKNIQGIKLNMCLGAGRSEQRADASFVPFAKRLAIRMGALGYNSVVVGGYQVTAERKDVLAGNVAGGYDPKEKSAPLKGKRFWFDSRGAELGQGERADFDDH